MKKLVKILLFPFIATALAGCDFGGGSSSNIHKKSFEPITGKFVLHDVTDPNDSEQTAYFEIDGSKGNFSLKYYENGALKKEGKFQRIVTYEEKIGKVQDNLHFNIKCENSTEHISTYTESLDPINQFRIIEEYNGNDTRYYLSELPFIMGTYLREGASYKEESLKEGEKDYLTPTIDCFTSALHGRYELDSDNYFYFVYPKINDYYATAFFQYYSSSLDKPLEGFVYGKFYHVIADDTPQIYLSYSREVLFSKALQDKGNVVLFGYTTFDANDNMIEHRGTIDFENGVLNSFSFEHLSREWTEEAWDIFTRDQSYSMPDPIIYDYIGGTYLKVA